MIINYYDLSNTVVENRDEKKIIDNNFKNDYISLNEVIIPNNYVGIKGREN